MNGEQTTRGLVPTLEFLDRVNQLGAEGTALLASARSAGDDMVAILETWSGPGLVTEHIRHVVSDPVMGPQLLKVVDLLIRRGAPFEVQLEDGVGAVAYAQGPDHMVVVVASP